MNIEDTSYIEKNLVEAIQNHKKNNFGIAENIYKKILKSDPNHYHSNIYLGMLLLQTKRFFLAKPIIEKIIKLNPNNAEAHNNLGVINKELFKYQNAIKFFSEAIKINPNYVNAHNNLGNTYKDLGLFNEAIESLNTALNLDNTEPVTYNNIGSVYIELEKFDKAIEYFKKAIQLKTNYLNAHNNLGYCYQQTGDYLKAINFYKNAIEIDPEFTISINNLSLILKLIKLNNLSNNNYFTIKKLFLFLLKKKNINHTEIFNNAKLFLYDQVEKEKIEKIIFVKSELLKEKIIEKKCIDSFFLLLLKKSLVVDKFLEKILTNIRFELIDNLKKNNHKFLEKYKNFCISLAQQCWLNEYVYYQTNNELDFIENLKKKVEKDIKINELEVSILGCYYPLNKSHVISRKLINYKSKNLEFEDLILTQVKEPATEESLKKTINSFSQITNKISQEVKIQYEENPYPRWKHSYKYIPDNFITILNNEIYPNKVKNNENFKNPEVLIAGCGTGNHLNQASRYINAKVTGIDLSLSSLAYAKRKIIELGYNNIDLFHGDILDIKNLHKKFDVIESIGTLHHMEDPIKGLEILTHVLKPQGYLKIGLYSELARDYVIKGRELIKKYKFQNTIHDIRKCRELIFNDNENDILQKIINRADFYSTSNVRDLIFHVKEHRFTIPQISEILKSLDLQFLGFNNSIIKSKFMKLNSKDKILSLKDWDIFEKKNPNTFIGMYQFWLKKKN
jgi:tetratricopeptide (TPR) repeat protein